MHHHVILLCILLHSSDHDLRIDLSSFKIATAEDYPTFCEFLSTIEMTSPNSISLVPAGPNREWTVSIIRQKTTKAYNLECPEGKKYLITICSVHEYRTKEKDLKPSDRLEVDMDTIKERIEIEVRTFPNTTQLYWRASFHCLQ